jgi:hypothetical protein
VKLPSVLREALTGPAIALLIAVPLTVGGAAGGLANKYLSANYQASGVASVLLLSGYRSSFDIAPFSADLAAVLKSGGVAAEAARAAGGNGGHLAATTSSDSTVLYIDYSANSADGARKGLTAAVRSSFALLAAQGQQRARLEVDAATASVTQASRDLSALRQSSGYQAVGDQYQRRLSDLKAETDKLAVTADPAQRAEVQAAVTAAQADVNRLAAPAADERVKDSTLQAATARLNEAVQQRAVEDGVVQAVGTAKLVDIQGVQMLSKRSGVLRAALSGFVGGLVAAMAVVMAWRRRGRGRRAEVGEPTSDQPESLRLPVSQIKTTLPGDGRQVPAAVRRTAR